MTPSRPCRLAPVVAASIALVACGGGTGDVDDGAGDDRVTATEVGTEQPSDDGPGVTSPGGPVNGALVSVLSAELGLVAVDRTTGATTALASGDVGYVERNQQPITVGDMAYTTGFTDREGQTFSHDVSLVAVDRTTGSLSKLAELGVDRVDDDATDSVSYSLDATDRSSAWVTTVNVVDGTAERSVRRYDLAAGSLSSEWVEPSFVIDTDDGASCSGGVSGLTSSTDGSVDGLFGVGNGWPVRIDVDAEQVEGLVDLCGDGAPLLETFIDASNVDDFVVTESGDPVTSDDELIADLLFLERPSVSGDQIVVADGRVWWYFNELLVSGDETMYVGGIAELDLATNTLTDLHPLGDVVVTWLPDDPDFDSEPLYGELTWRNGAMWMIDARDDGDLLRVDPTTGAVDTFPVDPQDADYTSATFIDSDPDAIWLAVTRWTRDPDDDGSSRGDRYVQRIDADGSTSIDIDETELIRL